jgi:small membrane protein
MIAQIFFSLLLCTVFLYAWIEYRRSPVVAVLSSVVALAGLYFVWVPSHSTWLAEFVGIGRGVDLILYTWVGISLIVILNLHLKLRTQLELITVLARKIALADGTSLTEVRRDSIAPRVSIPNDGTAVSDTSDV